MNASLFPSKQFNKREGKKGVANAFMRKICCCDGEEKCQHIKRAIPKIDKLCERARKELMVSESARASSVRE